MPPIGHASAEPAASILVTWPCYAPASAAAPSELQLIGDRLRVDARLGEAGKPSLALPGGGRPSRPRIGQPLPPVPLVALTRSRSSSAPVTVPGPAPAAAISTMPPAAAALPLRHAALLFRQIAVPFAATVQSSASPSCRSR